MHASNTNKMNKSMAATAKTMIKINLMLTLLGLVLLVDACGSITGAQAGSIWPNEESKSAKSQTSSIEEVEKTGSSESTGLGASEGKNAPETPLLRSRRWAHNNAQRAGDNEAIAQQQLVRRDIDPESSSQAKVLNWLEDEQLLRRQLPELIAQAYNDKQMERVLLKMLINASTKSALSQLQSAMQPTQAGATSASQAARVLQRAAQPSAAAAALYYGSGADDIGNTGRSSVAMDFGLDNSARFLDPARLASMEQSLGSDYASADGSTYGANVGPSAGADALSQVFEKREHVKPCLFNAISCPKYPFSKVAVNKGYR